MFGEATNQNTAQMPCVYTDYMVLFGTWNIYACCILLVKAFSAIYDTKLSVMNDA